jgi:hypothetical protein
MVTTCRTETISGNGQLKLLVRLEKKPDAGEAQRLLTIAEYWVRLADSEDWTQNQPAAEPHQSQ